MKLVASVYQKGRQIGEPEAIYRLLPELHLSKSNIKCKFAITGPPEKRSNMYRLATEKQINAGVHCIKLDGKDGLWYQQPDNLSKYNRRPDEIEKMCLAQFVMMYDSYSKSSDDGDETALDDDKADDEAIEEEQEEDPVKVELGEEEVLAYQEDSSYLYDYIMTYHEEGTAGKKLPKTIELKDPIPGEAKQLKKREKAAALRFFKVIIIIIDFIQSKYSIQHWYKH